MNRAQEVESELGGLRTQYSKVGIGLPITMTAVGFGGMIPIALLAVVAAAFGMSPAPYVAAALVSGAVGVAGLALLSARKRARKPLAERIHVLEAERRELLPVSIDASIGPRSASLLLQVRF